MRILIADQMAVHVTDSLKSYGYDVSVDSTLKDEALVSAIEQINPHILIVRSTKVRAQHILSAESLALIIRAGAGTNNIDIQCASDRGIYVANCPGQNAIAVAELALGHLLNLDRKISDNVQSLREGQWRKKHFAKGPKGLFGKTIAVIGTGSCGYEVIRRVKAFGMNVKAWSRSLTPDKAIEMGVQYAATPLEACQGADALSVHLSLSDQTRGIIGKQELEALNKGGYVINTSRGGIIDEEALLIAIEKHALCAGLDVFENEPASDGNFMNDTTQNASVYGTHHIGASTVQASDAVGDATIDIVNTWHKSGVIKNCVNLAYKSPADYQISIRHADKVGVLAFILEAIREHNHNIQEMENIIFQGGKAACAQIQIVGKPSKQMLDLIKTSENVFSVTFNII